MDEKENYVKFEYIKITTFCFSKGIFNRGNDKQSLRGDVVIIQLKFSM